MVQTADEIIKRVAHRTPCSVRIASSTPLTNPGACAPQNVFAVSTASSIAPAGEIGCSAGSATPSSYAPSATSFMMR
ncbi:MAG: hypothetical protein NVS1B9_12810 [Solirubrobacteraceae bacterium]